MRSIIPLIAFKVRISHILKKFILNNINPRFLHPFVLIMEKVPRLTAKDYTFKGVALCVLYHFLEEKILAR